MKRVMVLSAGLALLGTVSVLPDAGLAGVQRCTDAASRHVSDLGIDQSDVQEVSVLEQTQIVDGEPKIIGYQAWIGLNSCDRGKLVVKMSLQCQYKTAFTTSSCEVEGVCH